MQSRLQGNKMAAARKGKKREVRKRKWTDIELKQFAIGLADNKSEFALTLETLALKKSANIHIFEQVKKELDARLLEWKCLLFPVDVEKKTSKIATKGSSRLTCITAIHILARRAWRRLWLMLLVFSLFNSSQSLAFFSRPKVKCVPYLYWSHLTVRRLMRLDV